MTALRAVTVAVAGFILAAAAVTAGGASPAAAHDQLVSASPAAGETVGTVAEVALTFSRELLGADSGGNLATVTGPDGLFYETACAAVDGGILTLPVTLGSAGTYRVDWRAVSSDGHPISGTYEFTYAPASAAAVAGSDAHPCADVSTAEQPTESDASQGVDTGLVTGLVIGAVAVVAVGAIVVLILRRRA